MITPEAATFAQERIARQRTPQRKASLYRRIAAKARDQRLQRVAAESPGGRERGALSPVPVEAKGDAKSLSRVVEAYRQLQQRKAEKLVTDFDTNGTGKLEADQVKTLLSTWGKGGSVTEDELAYMMAVCDKDRDSAIGPAEVKYLREVWLDYQKHLAGLEALIEQHVGAACERLSSAQLHALLTHLNRGKPVDKKESAWVLQQADVLGNGVISKPALVRAVAAWYTHVDTSGDCLASIGACLVGLCGSR